MSAAPLADGRACLESFIAQHGVDASIQQVPGGTPTAQSAAQALGVPLDAVIKTLILFGARTFVAAVLAGNRKLDRRKLANALGIGVLRLATAREVLEETGYPPGGVAPIGLRKRMPVVIDEDLMKTPMRTLVAGGGREDLLMRISAHEIALFTGAQVAPICKEPGYGL